MDSKDPIEKLRGWVRSTRADGLGPFGTSLEELDGIADALEAETAESKRRINSYGLMNTELNDALSAICNRFGVDTELAAEDSAKNILEALERGWIRLPVDADGVPIRPGDDVQLTDGRRADANCITYFEDTVDVGSDGWNPIWLRHAKPETVENILGEAIQFGHHANTGTRLEGVIEEYAERIRKAVCSTEVALVNTEGWLWVDKTEYDGLVDAKDERDRLRAEVKKLGEQLDRLRNDRGMA